MEKTIEQNIIKKHIHYIKAKKGMLSLDRFGRKHGKLATGGYALTTEQLLTFLNKK